MKAISKITKVDKLNPGEKISILSDRIIHRRLDRLIIALFNLNLIEATSQVSNQDDVDTLITQALNTPVHYHLYGIKVYTWIPSSFSWHNNYRRALWRVWGHIRWGYILDNYAQENIRNYGGTSNFQGWDV